MAVVSSFSRAGVVSREREERREGYVSVWPGSGCEARVRRVRRRSLEVWGSVSGGRVVSAVGWERGLV